jgi:hypothetical protein
MAVALARLAARLGWGSSQSVFFTLAVARFFERVLPRFRRVDEPSDASPSSVTTVLRKFVKEGLIEMPRSN